MGRRYEGRRRDRENEGGRWEKERGREGRRDVGREE